MKNSLVKGVCKVLGAGHFVTQSTADLLLTAEAGLAYKALGNDRLETMKHRISKTNAYQRKSIECVLKLKRSKK